MSVASARADIDLKVVGVFEDIHLALSSSGVNDPIMLSIVRHPSNAPTSNHRKPRPPILRHRL
eukprot:10692021-Prorocentrum_lima.AAC.1